MQRLIIGQQPVSESSSKTPENSLDQLSVPFSSWREGLLHLANDLPEAARQRILLSRLGATAAQSGIGIREVCALALLVPSHARFDKKTLSVFKWFGTI